MIDRHHTTTWPTAFAVLASALAFGCGADLVPEGNGGADGGATIEPGAPDASTIPGTVIIGTGFDTWHPIVDGQDLILFQGLQGGRHIEGNALVADMWPGETREDAPAAVFSVKTLDGLVLTEPVPPTRQPLTEYDGDSEDHYCYPRGVFVYMNRDALDYDGQVVEMSVTIEDKDGKTASDSRLITLRVDQF